LPEHVQEVVGQDSHKQPSPIGGEATATGLVPAQRVLTFLDPILNVAPPVVHLDHLPRRELGIGHDKPDPWEEFPLVPFDLGYHSTLSVPRLGPIPEINQPHLNSTLGRPPHGTRQVRVNESVQHRIGRKPDEVRDPFTFAIPVHARISKGCVTSKPEQDESGPIPLHYRIEELQNAIGRMNVARSELRPQAVAVADESEERVKAVLPEMTVERLVLLLAVRGVFGRIYVQDQTLLTLSPYESVIGPRECSFQRLQSIFGPKD